MRLTPTYGIVFSIQRASIWKVPSTVAFLIIRECCYYICFCWSFSAWRERHLLFSHPPHENYLQWFSLLERETCKGFSSNAQKNCHFIYKCLFFILFYLFCKTMFLPLQFIGGWKQQMTLSLLHSLSPQWPGLSPDPPGSTQQWRLSGSHLIGWLPSHPQYPLLESHDTTWANDQTYHHSNPEKKTYRPLP